jgi:hypothetical protein
VQPDHQRRRHKTYPESLLGQALEAQGETGEGIYAFSTKGPAGGMTLSFWGRDPALFNLAIDVYAQSGLEGLNLAPDGFTLEQVAQELHGYWHLPYQLDHLRKALVPRTAHHLRLLTAEAAAQMWQQMMDEVARLLSSNPTSLLNRGMAVFALETSSCQSGSHFLRTTHLASIRDGHLLAQISRQWERAEDEGALEVDWDRPKGRSGALPPAEHWPGVGVRQGSRGGTDGSIEWRELRSAFDDCVSDLPGSIWGQLQRLVEQGAGYGLHAVSLTLRRSKLSRRELHELGEYEDYEDRHWGFHHYEEELDEDEQEQEQEEDERLIRVLPLIVLKW